MLEGEDADRKGNHVLAMPALEGELGEKLAELLTADEIEALAAHCVRLRTTAVFPGPSGGMPAVPWPLF